MTTFFKKLTIKQKIILGALTFVFACDIGLLAKKYLSKTSPLSLAFTEEMQVSTSKLRALNANAKSKKARAGYAYYRFTEEQRKSLVSYIERFGDAALSVRIRVSHKTAGADKAFMLGFLFADDFTFRGRLQKEIEKRPLASFVAQNLAEFVLAFSFEKDEMKNGKNVPYGFFVYAAVPSSIIRAEIRRGAIGWDRSASVPLFAFAPNGGVMHESPAEADFSGASLVFPSQNTDASVMPKIVAAFYAPDDWGTAQNPAKTELNAGGEKLIIFRTDKAQVAGSEKKAYAYDIQTTALANPFSTVSCSDKINNISVLMMTRSDVKNELNTGGKILAPFATDPGLIISWPRSKWRTGDYELFEWDRFPGVLIIDTKDFAVQNDFFKRLAFFSEKMGYRGTLLTDEALEGMHGFNAHDYSAASLAAFFTKARSENFPLNQRELLLRDILLTNGVIAADGASYAARKGALISISQESPEWLRNRYIAHEGWHGIFFTDENFRNATAAVFYTTDETSRDFLMSYWQLHPNLNYDLNDEYLVHNEFMAYIMQQNVSAVAAYFVNLANWTSVQKAIPSLAAYVRQTHGIPFEDAAKVFDEYAFDNWGLSCGRVWLIR
ncbi:hypothetical protein [Treponema sp. Marseille-Q4130]|uniref:hypothetical protein n=1 Tax=Treponema sp. Marseille-Q4130 TaxID=2766702 RepID=UPI00165239CC|nr:hypothetical protein [Treponema sp. Marseille-Q4130]MBC6721303.1 hypothetical protein [Treponema sp. Marseille-Q4130]